MVQVVGCMVKKVDKVNKVESRRAFFLL